MVSFQEGSELLTELAGVAVDAKLFGSHRAQSRNTGTIFQKTLVTTRSKNYQRHSDSTCELSRIRNVYLDPKRRNPQSAEWRDADGNLRFPAYYDYEIDDHRNWTRRQIWVWSQSLGERKLYETDSGSITYWAQ